MAGSCFFLLGTLSEKEQDWGWRTSGHGFLLFLLMGAPDGRSFFHLLLAGMAAHSTPGS